MSRAVCLRCGADKGAPEHVCPACGHRPDGDGLLVAWLLSDAHLDADGLDRAAARIRAGEPVRPSPAMLDRARAALRPPAADDGLGPWRMAGLAILALLVTPAVGIALAIWWWGTRPRSARQALWVSIPPGILASVAIGWLWVTSVLGG